ncbi:MAG: Gfo/Idh/MocA family oxidoreductase [Phycisphaeraceae bacterium]|nr:Gfo/Idh/MocA family oxidoreductase [Phycisphaeraceae bacterium]
MSYKNPAFNTDKRIRLGIWGLGRGMNFYKTCAALGLDVVAGCDFNQHMRERFSKDCPGAFVTEDAAKFLAQDFDAVLLATFCPNHADDAIACLKAGKHVLSEVTSFHTMAEGVRLVEAVEKSGLVYNLAENYPFSASNMWLAAKWKEGLFGELLYGEYSYIHEVRSLQYTYIDGVPVQPGWTVHNWRSWLNAHYYNTHSLGPMMIITGLRPTRVVSLRSSQNLPAYIMRQAGGKWGVPCPSLINMSNGGVVRNLMGAMTDDTNIQRLWGTKGSAEQTWSYLKLRLGGGGESPKFDVKPRWPFMAEFAEKTGHGGGDFWVLYYFARQILTGEPAPFEIYTACDCTIQGLLGYRSSMEGGKPFDIPDFRDKTQREPYRNDTYAQPRYDTQNGAFPENADKNLVQHFTTVMKHLDEFSKAYRAWADWSSLAEDMKEPAKALGLADRVAALYPTSQPWLVKGRQIADAYPDSDGARVISDMLEQAGEAVSARPDFLKVLEEQRAELARRVTKLTVGV